MQVTTYLLFTSIQKDSIYKQPFYRNMPGGREGNLKDISGVENPLSPASTICHIYEPNNTIIQNIIKMFHKAMKIRKYRRLSRNSRMLSPVVAFAGSSPNPWDSFFFSLKFNTAPALTSNVPNNNRSPIIVPQQQPAHQPSYILAL